MWPLDVVEISQNQEFLYEKQALSQSQYRKKLDVGYQYIHVDAISKVYLHTTTKISQLWTLFRQVLSGGRLHYLLDFSFCSDLL